MISSRAFALLTGLLAHGGIGCAEVPLAVAIKDAHVVTVSGADLPKATVLLRDGLIVGVGADLTIPPDSGVIDGQGLTVYPGFIDGLSTWGIPASAPSTRATAAATPAPAAGAAATPAAPAPITPETEPVTVTQARLHGPEGRPQNYSFDRAADMVTPTDTRLKAARAAGFTSAATFPNRGIFEGLGAMVNLAGEQGRDMVVAQPIGQEIAFRVGGGGMGRAFPASLMGNIAYVRQLYLDLDHYKAAQQMQGAGMAKPQYDHDLEALRESPRILLPADRVQQISRMLSFGRELKTPFVLYGLHEAYKCVPELKEANVPLLISLKWPEKSKNADPSEIPNYRDLELRAQAPAIPGMLAKAGVKFAFYSDGIDNAADLKKAVKKAIDAGLTRADAIRALTLGPADMYGVADRLGSIDKGKIANLVVTKGDAFDEKTTVEYVFIVGQQFRPVKESERGTGADSNSAAPKTPAENTSTENGVTNGVAK